MVFLATSDLTELPLILFTRPFAFLGGGGNNPPETYHPNSNQDAVMRLAQERAMQVCKSPDIYDEPRCSQSMNFETKYRAEKKSSYVVARML